MPIKQNLTQTGQTRSVPFYPFLAHFYTHKSEICHRPAALQAAANGLSLSNGGGGGPERKGCLLAGPPPRDGDHGTPWTPHRLPSDRYRVPHGALRAGTGGRRWATPRGRGQGCPGARPPRQRRRYRGSVPRAAAEAGRWGCYRRRGPGGRWARTDLEGHGVGEKSVSAADWKKICVNSISYFNL